MASLLLVSRSAATGLRRPIEVELCGRSGRPSSLTVLRFLELGGERTFGDERLVADEAALGRLLEGLSPEQLLTQEFADLPAGTRLLVVCRPPVELRLHEVATGSASAAFGRQQLPFIALFGRSIVSRSDYADLWSSDRGRQFRILRELPARSWSSGPLVDELVRFGLARRILRLLCDPELRPDVLALLNHLACAGIARRPGCGDCHEFASLAVHEQGAVLDCLRSADLPSRRLALDLVDSWLLDRARKEVPGFEAALFEAAVRHVGLVEASELPDGDRRELLAHGAHVLASLCAPPRCSCAWPTTCRAEAEDDDEDGDFEEPRLPANLDSSLVSTLAGLLRRLLRIFAFPAPVFLGDVRTIERVHLSLNTLLWALLRADEGGELASGLAATMLSTLLPLAAASEPGGDAHITPHSESPGGALVLLASEHPRLLISAGALSAAFGVLANSWPQKPFVVEDIIAELVPTLNRANLSASGRPLCMMARDRFCPASNRGFLAFERGEEVFVWSQVLQEGLWAYGWKNIGSEQHWGWFPDAVMDRA